MTAIAWRRTLLGLFCVALVVIAYQGWLWAHFGSTGISLDNHSAGLSGVVSTRITVEPGSAAYRAGLRTGDSVDLGALASEARYRWSEMTIAGERFAVPLRSSAGIRVVSVVARHAKAIVVLWFAFAGFAWLALFGGLLAWRRADSDEARVLTLLLIGEPLLAFLQISYVYTPWIQADLAANAIGSLSSIPFALLATYAMLFKLPRSGVRRVLAALAYAAAAAGVVLSLWLEISTWRALAPPPDLLDGAVGSTVFLAPFVCALLTVFQAKGAQRVRVAWVTASVGFFYAVLGLYNLVVTVDPSFNWRFTVDVVDLAPFIAPLGLMYSLLNRRVLDIGFAINRAVVFTGVSVVIVGIFVLVEWALSEWFSSASHTTNLAISAALALVLGLSVRAIHSRVDRVLDTMFFRKRHEDEEAIRTLAREAAYITDPQVLLARTEAVLEEHADASSVQVLLDDGAGSYADADKHLSENDPAIVRLRASRKTLDLHDVQTAVQGEFAYPMLARGRLVGVLVLGLKRSGESYAPDESDAIAQLAHDAGAALDVLSMKKVPERNAVLEGIASLREGMQSLGDEMRDLSRRVTGGL